MSSNNDNAMTRFLFAILRQKNLKDIDWTKVAHDPILAQEITNGHAARMRYSRFRSAMLGLEPTRRNRTGPPKSRVTKSKKDPKARKDEGVKSESAVGSPAAQEQEQPRSEPAAPKIKQENSQYAFDNRLTPGLTPGPMTTAPPISNTPILHHQRLLTPCSDADAFASSPTLAASPTSDMINSQNAFDFHPPPYPNHTDSTWQHVGPYSPFAAYPFDDYVHASSCDNTHLDHHSQDQLGLLNPTIEGDGGHINVKRENWDQYD